jgi:methylmalonyl-CoA/ethylmalonyl-CoA epimerase
LSEPGLACAPAEIRFNPAAALRFDHLGLIVPELETGRSFLADSLGISQWTAPLRDPALGVEVQFGASEFGGPVYELVAPLGHASPITNALRCGKHILNHVAYLTDDLARAAQHLREAGCYPAGAPQAALAYDRQLIQFWVSPLKFVIELIEKPGHVHAFAGTRS